MNNIRDIYCTNIFKDFSTIEDLAYTWGRMKDTTEEEDDEDEEIITRSSLKAACKVSFFSCSWSDSIIDA